LVHKNLSGGHEIDVASPSKFIPRFKPADGLPMAPASGHKIGKAILDEEGKKPVCRDPDDNVRQAAHVVRRTTLRAG